MIDARKKLLLAAGFFLVGLAVLGIVLPLLPTTPLLILAAACFANVSERWHQWLMDHRLFGPILKNWHEHRCMPLRAKMLAVATILLFGTYAVCFALENIYARGGGALLIGTGLIVVLRIPICSNKD